MKQYLSAFGIFWGFFLFSFAALAQTGAEDVAENIADSTTTLPALISASAYLMGILFGVLGVFKTLEHVSTPETISTRPPLRAAIIRFFVGGAFFALPMIYETVNVTINGGAASTFDPTTDATNFMGFVSGTLGILSVFGTIGTDFNAILANIDIFTDELPALIAVLGYLLGLIVTFSGVLRLKEHVDEPDRVTIKEPVMRLLTGGALFALPTVFEAMYTTIAGTGGLLDFAASIYTGVSFLISSENAGIPECLAAFGLGGNTVGGVICHTMAHSFLLPNFLTGIAYLLGLIFGIWGILKVRDHVLNPSQTKLSEGVTRLIAGGAFFAFPLVGSALQTTMTPVTVGAATILGTNTGTSGTLTCATTNGLDEALGCFMADVLGPTHVVWNFFCFVAGLILTMIGISRLIKTAQDGPRGPGGIGTVTTFVIAGLLMSANVIMRAFTSTMFGGAGFNPVATETTATLTYAGGMTVAETNATYNVIDAVLRFMFIIGIISFARGLFIIRNVAEGQQQASIMVAMTHIIGGVLAVNLGPLLNAIQQTLGITAFGVTFA